MAQQDLRWNHLIVFMFIWTLLLNGCRTGQASSAGSGQVERWKSYAQLEADLKIVTNAGYERVCVFDLKSIGNYPDPRYIALLAQYAAQGTELTVFVQEIAPDQTTLDLVRRIGASSVILYDKDLWALFEESHLKTSWWSGVAFPPRHKERPQYKGWPDLRSDQIRQDIANWAVQTPQVDGGLVLDYIRWNQVGDGRNAEQVVDLVRQIRAKWNSVGSGPLAAAVFPYLGQSPSDGGALSVGQEWNKWLQEGLVDLVYPMAYISQDIPWLIQQWKPYDKHTLVPCLSVIDYH